MGELQSLACEHTGHDFAGYKPVALCRAVARRMERLGVGLPREYLEHTRRHPAELVSYAREVLVGATSFFRDPDAFEAFGVWLGRALEALQPQRPLRIWVAGCATGQEAYSVAIVLREQMHALGISGPATVFATDILQDALEAARRGWYPKTIADHVSGERLRRWFVPSRGGYEVAPAVRRTVVFGTQDLLASPPLADIDVLCCRNLLIYFDPRAQQELVATFGAVLRPGGLLFVGPAETLPERDDLMLVDHDARVYRRRDAPEDLALPPRAEARVSADAPRESLVEELQVKTELVRSASLQLETANDEMRRRLVCGAPLVECCPRCGFDVAASPSRCRRR